MASFCDVCDNLLYIRGAAAAGGAVMACNQCGVQRTLEAGGGSVLVSETRYDNDAARYTHYVTKDLHADPSLPRIAMACKRPGCGGRRALYVEYDPESKKYLYSCTQCFAFWGPDGLIEEASKVAPVEEASKGAPVEEASKGAPVEEASAPAPEPRVNKAAAPTAPAPKDRPRVRKAATAAAP